MGIEQTAKIDEYELIMGYLDTSYWTNDIASWFSRREKRTKDFRERTVHDLQSRATEVIRNGDKHYRSPFVKTRWEVDMTDTRPEIPYINGCHSPVFDEESLTDSVYFLMERRDSISPVPKYTRTHSNEPPQTRGRLKGVKMPYDLVPKKEYKGNSFVNSALPAKKNWKVGNELGYARDRGIPPDPKVLRQLSWTYHAPKGRIGKINMSL